MMDHSVVDGERNGCEACRRYCQGMRGELGVLEPLPPSVWARDRHNNGRIIPATEGQR